MIENNRTGGKNMILDDQLHEQLVEDFDVYEYHYIDELKYIYSPEDMYEDKELMNQQITLVKEAFLENGWEGDGKIGVIWIPPFAYGLDDTVGSFIWHVKQDNNGTSYLAFNKEDVFRGIFVDEIGRSEKEYKFLSTIDTQEYIDITIIETIAENFISELDKLKQKLEEAYKLRQDDILTESLYESIITYIQGDVIANLNVFMDESYLKYLLHVLNDNNPDNLKLRPIKSNIRLDDISMNYEKGCNISWMVIQQIVTNCWQDYKFLNFKEKFLNITKPVDYVCNLNTKEEIFKHVLIRNCYQHHEGELTDDALKLIGKDKIYIRSNNDSKLEIKKWAIIKLTYEEVEHLIDAMSEFASDYNQHIARRMKVREKKKDTSRHMRELINYIYYLQYEENVDDIVVKTREAYFTVFESSTFKVNYEESSAEELYQLIDECGGEAECNGVIFKKIGDKYEAEYNIPTLVRNEQPNIIQL